MPGVGIPGKVKGLFIDGSRDHPRDTAGHGQLHGRLNELDGSRSWAPGGLACSNATQRGFQRIETPEYGLCE